MSRAGRLALLAVAICLAVPASAAGQARTFGSPLDSTPNTFGCETQPRNVGTFDGNYAFVASGQPDCTWWNWGVYGNASVRTGGVPGDGRVTSISVRSGPNPALMRFTVVRLYGGGLNRCCFYTGQQSALVRPRPNRVTTIPVNFTVESNTNPFNGLRTQDFIGVSAVSGTGLLPLRGNGRHNTLNDYVVGNPTAGFVYPRLGAQANDSGGGRPQDGLPGFEVLLRAVWCPAGQTCGAGGGGALPGAPIVSGARFGPSVFRVARGNTPLIARARRGSRLRFRLNEPSSVRIRIERQRPGRRSRGKCRRPSRRLRGARRCKRWVRVATLRRTNQPAGRRSLVFTGRIRRRALKPGRYRAVIKATDGTRKSSRVKRPRFRIVRR